MNQASAPTRHLVIIDSQVNNWQSLATDAGTDAAVLILDSSADGLTQINDYLATTDAQDFTPLQSIHIISHGSSGRLLLGSTTLTAGNLSLYSRQLATLGDALAENGDILLYGCNVAAGQAGLQFINRFADLTQADVAASNDITGAAILGGDWQLETSTGTIESSLAISTPTLSNHSDTLVATGVGDFNGQGITYGYSVAMQTDGKILLGGYTSDESWDFVLVRYTSNGLLDTSFDSDGKAITDLLNYNDIGKSVTVQTDGKILLGGSSFNPDNNYYDFALVRYNSNGSLDASFDSDGIVTTDLGGTDASATSVALQADGKILLGGTSGTASNSDFALARYNSNGSLDTSFDSDGIVTIDLGGIKDYGYSVAVQADGKILLAGTNYAASQVPGSSNNVTYEYVLVRYNSDGSLDTNFGNNGKITTDLASFGGYADVECSVTVQTDGKILLAGTYYEEFDILFSDFMNPESILMRYNSDGSLDTSFGSDGKVTYTVESSFYGKSVTVQADGKILLGGFSYDVINSYNREFALVRYNSNGSLDTSFNYYGYAVTDVSHNDFGQPITPKYEDIFGYVYDDPGYQDFGQSVAVQADGRILLGGYSDTTNNHLLALVRYNSNGSLDTSFGAPTTTNPASFFDTTAPTVSTFSPTDESASAGVADNIVITFDEAIQKGAGNIILMTASGRTVETFKIATSKAVSISGETITINPSKDLSYETAYKLKIPSWAITDLSYNAYIGLTSYNFSTTDTLTTSASSYTLTFKDPRKLIYSGTNDFTGAGNKAANVITAGIGNDTLNGGLGKDSLTGGDGTDQFVFNTKLGKANIDAITDFTAGTDKIVLDHAIFKKLSSALTSSQLVSGTAAIDSNDYLIYNATSGSLFYDADGSGRGKAVEIAVIGTSLNLTADDFVIS